MPEALTQETPAQETPTQETLLELSDVSVSFDGFRALDGVSMRVAPQGVRVLIGPNGAGKSTLCDLIIGKVRSSGGRVRYRGRDITRTPEYRIVRRGILRKFQAPGVLGRLSVYDNLAVAAKEQKGWWHGLRTSLGGSERAKVDEVLGLVGLSAKRDSLAEGLAHGEKQWLEIGMVVAADPELLLLDEPTAGMTAQETAATAELIHKLAETRAVLVIDHDMTFVELLGAPVSVLHQGRLLKEGTLAEVRADPEVVSVYLGRSPEELIHA